MALTTLHAEPGGAWSVEEDRSGRLWLEVVVGSAELYSIHYPLTPEEIGAFRGSPAALRPLVRRVLTRPMLFADKRAEADYRRQGGG